MKKIKVLSEQNSYEKGKRINVQTLETVSSLSDDMAALANYTSTLAAHQATVEKLTETMPDDVSQKRAFEDEINRLRGEMQTLKHAIAVQEEYIKGFDNNEV